MSKEFSVAWHKFSIPKMGNTDDENEDAIRPPANKRTLYRKKEFRCAIADGATQAAFAGLWAELLVEYSQCYPLCDDILNKVLQPAADRWQAEVNTKDLAWNVQMKVEQGAHATLTALNLKRSLESNDDEGIWYSIAIGDSCLFQIRGETILTAYPIQNSSDFGNYPPLLSSLLDRNVRAMSQKLAEGTWRDGDLFMLMTDALAHWCLTEREGGRNPFLELNTEILERKDTDAAFSAWVVDKRNGSQLRNDDTTLAVIKITTSDKGS